VPLRQRALSLPVPLRLLLAEGQTQKTVGDVKEAFKAVTSR
jgi:hypothetical protein